MSKVNEALLIAHREGATTNRQGGVTRGGRAASFLSAGSKQAVKKSAVASNESSSDKRAHLRAKMNADSPNPFNQDNLKDTYKSPDVWAPAVSAARMRVPYVATSRTLTTAVDEVYTPVVYIPQSVMLNQATTSLTLPSAGTTSKTYQSVISAAQGAFKAGRFSRIVEGSEEVAIIKLKTEVEFHVEMPDQPNSLLLLNVDFDIRHSLRYNQDVFASTNMDRIYYDTTASPPELRDNDNRLEFRDNAGQVNVSPPGTVYEASRLMWRGEAYFTQTVTDRYAIFKMTRLWTTRTKVIEELGPEIPGSIGPDGFPQRVKTQRLTTTATSVGRLTRLF